MKKSAFKITIPKPCHENWQTMTPEAKGRFCQKCAKTVHDFSQKTDRQIAKVYQENDGKVCGRFHREQLNRSIAPYEPTPKEGNWTMAGMILSGVLAVGQVYGQNCSPNIKGKMVLTEKVAEESLILGEMVMEDALIIISGKVTDENNQPLVGAIVRIIGLESVFTDTMGDYYLEIPRNYEQKEIVVEFFALDFESEMKIINFIQKQDVTLNTTLKKIKSTCKKEEFYMIGDFELNPEDLHYTMGFVINIPVEESSLLDKAKQLIYDTKERLIEKRNQTGEQLKPENRHPQEDITPDFILPNPISPPHFIQKIYPNPFVDYLKIEIHSAEEEALEFVLYDANGRTVFKQENEISIGTNLVEMDFSHLNLKNGNYFISIFQKGEIVQTEMVLKMSEARP